MWDIPGADVTQLTTACEKQVQDYEQQSGNTVSDAIKLLSRTWPSARCLFARTPAFVELAIVRHVHPDGSWTNSRHGKNDVVRPIADGSECSRRMLSVMRARREVTLRKTAGTKPTRDVARARKARKVKERTPHPRMATPTRNGLVTTVMMLDIFS